MTSTSVLGPVRVSGNGVTVLERTSHRRLLAILALHANRAVETDGAARAAGYFIDFRKAREFFVGHASFYAAFYYVADAVIILGSSDIVLSEVDR